MAKSALKECPICGKPSVETFNPFCCQRCADVDLSRWLGEKYVVPTDEPAGLSDKDSLTEET